MTSTNLLSATDLSTARHVAMTLNCGCGVCDTCEAIQHGRHLDVIEWSGTADITPLIANVPYAPALARYKVYIIDNVYRPFLDAVTIPENVRIVLVS